MNNGDSYKDLSSIWEVDPMSFQMAMGQLQRRQQLADVGLQEALFNQEQQKQKAPLDIERARLNNEAASLSNEAQGYKNKATRATIDSDIETQLARNSQIVNEGQLKELDRHGQGLSQIGELLNNVPPPARAAAANQLLKQYGLDNIASHLQNVPIDKLPAVLSTTGKQMMQVQSKLFAEMEKQKMISDTKMALEAERSRRSLSTISLRNSLKAASDSAKATKDPKTLEGLAAKIRNQIMNESDPDRIAELKVQYAETLGDLYELKQASARANASVKPDINELGLKTNPNYKPDFTPGKGEVKKGTKENPIKLD